MDHSIEKLQETVARLQKENEELKERLKPKPPSWNCGNCRKYNVGENQEIGDTYGYPPGLCYTQPYPKEPHRRPGYPKYDTRLELWECRQCGRSNLEEEDMCIKCGTYKKGKEPPRTNPYPFAIEVVPQEIFP